MLYALDISGFGMNLSTSTNLLQYFLGAHLPTAPPIPEAIQRALAYNAAHPEEDDGGQPRGFRRQ